ncbi:MAG: hypothetical protein Q7S68_05780, partial [Deltaproteobacteria bacterium]|nr:hypothetical protein [Deltaproteobacteria bacterium]
MGGANRGVRSVSFAHNAAARPLSLEGVVSKAEDLGTPSTVAKLEAEALAHRARRFDDANVVTAGLSEALAHRSTPTIPQSSFIDVGISPEVLIEAGWLPPQTIDRVLPESLRAEFEAWILAKESGLPPNDSPSLTTRHPWLQALITIDRETGQTNEMLVGLTSPETDVIERALRLLARDFLFRVASNLTASGYPNREVKIQITIYRYLVGSEGHRLSLHTGNGFF